MPIIYRNYNDLSKIIGGSFPRRVPQTGRLSELTSKWGYHGETLYMFQTDIIKQLTVPQGLDEKFWKLSAFYFPLNQKYKVYWLNVPAGESVYQPKGLSNNRLKNEINSPKLTLEAYKRGAVYHPLLLHRIANCCLYISWKRIFRLQDISSEKISILVYLFALFLEPIYCRGYRQDIKTYLLSLQP